MIVMLQEVIQTSVSTRMPIIYLLAVISILGSPFIVSYNRWNCDHFP